MILLSSRSPLESDSEAISVKGYSDPFKGAFVFALLSSGFTRSKDDNEETYVPCPLGTFTDTSSKGKGGCQNCLPGDV